MTEPAPADLPKATLRGGSWRPRPKHVIAAFGALSALGIIRTLVDYTLWFPPLGIVFDIAWFAPVIIPLASKRMTTIRALLCLAAFGGQALIFDLPEAIKDVTELEVGILVTLIGLCGGLVASVVAIVKPDPDPNFVPNEFTIR